MEYAGISYGESIPFSTKPVNPEYDPHSIIGTWQYYYGGGGFAGCDSTIFGTTSIREFSIDSMLISRFIVNSILLIFNDKFTVSGNTLIHLNESGEDIFHAISEIESGKEIPNKTVMDKFRNQYYYWGILSSACLFLSDNSLFIFFNSWAINKANTKHTKIGATICMSVPLPQIRS